MGQGAAPQRPTPQGLSILLLDSTVLIDVLRGGSATQRLVELQASGGAPPFVCAVNVEEVWRGARPPEIEGIRNLLTGLRIAPLDVPEGELAGRWRREFAERGATLSQADCLIAAAAVGVGARLATGNPGHFPMAELDVEVWPTGE